MLIKEYKNCRVCGSKDLNSIIYLGNHNLHGNFVYKNYPHPPTRKIPIHLLKCGECHLVQLSHSVDPVILYDKYGYRSGTNEKMVKHLRNLVFDITMYKSNIKDVLDIAANDLTLLKTYFPDIKKIGVDPCNIGLEVEKDENTTFINKCYPCQELKPKERFEIYPIPRFVKTNQFDVITCLGMFYDLNNPNEVAKNIADNLKDDGIAIIEVSYWPEKMKKVAVDELVIEHVCFYSLSTLKRVFSQAGLNIFKAIKNDINGGSIQIWLSKQDLIVDENVKNIEIEEFNDSLDTMKPYQDFKDRVERLKYNIQKLFKTLKKKRKVVHLYGSSTKGNVLLQLCELTNKDIPFAADRNPDKWGAKTLGSDIQIISEEESRKMKPDYYFCPIWAFKNEVLFREKEMIENGTKFIFPLPELEIVDKL